MAKMERASFLIILKKYQKAQKGGVRLTQSSLILMQPIDTTTKSYTFPVLDTDKGNTAGLPVLPEEIRLNMNDEFISYETAYYVQSKAVSAVAPAGPVANIYHTYAPVELMAATRVIDNAWDARMSISVNNIKRLENWDMLKHKCVTRTQWQNSSAGIPQATQASVCFYECGVASMQPMLTLSGAKKNDINITLSNSIPSGTTMDWITASGTLTSTFTNLTLVFRGMLAQNAAKFQ
jgi:hypothetical protein